MTIDNWIMIISAIIVAFGWFVTGYLNRNQDIAQRRLEYWLMSLKSFLPVWWSIQRAGALSDEISLSMLGEARANFQLYGYKYEIDKMEKFITAVEKKKVDEANASLYELIQLLRSSVRKELKIKPYVL